MSLRSIQVHNFHISRLFGTDLHLFEMSVWIQSFAMALISVFIPIILYTLGFEIKQILVFYVVFNLIDVPLNIVAKKLIQTQGARITVIIAIVAQLFYLITLYNIHNWPWLIVMLAFFLAVYDSFYWVGHLYIFVQAAHNKHSKIRKETSALNIVRIVGGLFAPAIGAFILIAGDQKTLIFFSTLLMFCSLLPLFKMRHAKFIPENPSPKFKEFFRQPHEKINFFFECFSAIKQEAEDVLWPFFIFLTYKSIREVSYIPMLIALAGIILTYITGRLNLHDRVYTYISRAAILIAGIWILRLSFLDHIGFLIGSVFLIATLGIFIDLPLEIEIFDRSKRTDALNSVTYLNMFRMGARFVFYAILFLATNLFATAFNLVIVSLIILFLLSAWVSYDKETILKLVPEPVEIEKGV